MSRLLPVASLAYRTPELPGSGGVLRQRDEDFLVEEQPLYQPAGSGEHLMLYIQKRGMTTLDVVHRLAKLFKVRRSDIGYAGLKDKHAVTRQHLSVYLPDASRDKELLARIAYTPFQLLWAQRHGNKLRRGHHAGNRFIIKVRDVSLDAVVRARRVVEALARRGAANFLGEQRFGVRQLNHHIGAALLRGQWRELLDLLLGRPEPTDGDRMREARTAYEQGDYRRALELWPMHMRHDRQALDAMRQHGSYERAVFAMDREQLDFFVCSLQSAVFNRVLDERLRRGLLDELRPGDLAWKHDSRAVFAVDEATARLENGAGGRVAKLEVSPSGPMWSAQMTQPTGEPLAWEQAAMRELGVTLEHWRALPRAIRAPGSRRPMRMAVKDPDVSAGTDECGPFLRLAFELERGCFATVVLREVLKNTQAEELPDTEQVT